MFNLINFLLNYFFVDPAYVTNEDGFYLWFFSGKNELAYFDCKIKNNKNFDIRFIFLVKNKKYKIEYENLD